MQQRAGASGEVSVAAVQWPLAVHRHFADFAIEVERALDMAAGADVVVFPEYLTLSLFTSLGGWRGMQERDYARIGRYTDDYVTLFQNAARQRNATILAGTHLVEGSDGRVRNVAHLFLADGTVHRHAKTHLFGDERNWCDTEGDDLCVVELPSCTVGVAVCYEAEFPEVATALAARGADLILCPAYTFAQRGFWRVRHCLHARCIENQVCAVHASLVGDVGAPLRPGVGRSAVLTPCDRGYPEDGVLAEVSGLELGVARATLSPRTWRHDRDGGEAPTRRDRSRRAVDYSRWSVTSMSNLLTQG
ncbi:MAG TPA: nitrilase-related carbon-nitrogen hydrolase [Candidatus Dormibacteraeota bacterium]|jgi:predicted amidohydrolase|nr:nitrilase-related carbon-nitrogen hydrolase [Candidatus Dormibacteraeota bacterium]